MTEQFTGFGPDATGFLERLEQNTSKEWFDANRSIYDDRLAAPMKALVVAVGSWVRR